MAELTLDDIIEMCKKEAIEIGREEVRRILARGIIRMALERNETRAFIIENLVTELDVTELVAEEYYEKYSKEYYEDVRTGAKVFIKVALELNKTRAFIIENLVTELGMTEPVAEEYYEKYSKEYYEDNESVANVLDHLLLNNDVEDLNAHKNRKEKFYKEYERIVFNYVSGATKPKTDKVEALKCSNNLYGENGRFYVKDPWQAIDCVSPEKIAERLVRMLDEKVETDKNLLRRDFSELLTSTFEDIAFLGEVYALQSLFDMREEIFRERESYKELLISYRKLPQIIDFLNDRVAIPIEDIEDRLLINAETLKDTITNTESLFNIRRFGEQELISLSPKGHKVYEYMKQKRNKRG